MESLIEGFMAILYDGSIWMAKGIDTCSPGFSRMILYRIGRDKHRVRGLGESMRLAREIYPWLFRHDPCIDMEVPLIHHNLIREVIDPRLAARKASGKAAELLDLLHEVTPGLTGSLALGLRGGDIDLVIYGFSESGKAYSILAELREKGVTRPLEGEALLSEYRKNVADTPFTLPEYRRIVSSKLLLGIYKGVPYSIRLIPVKKALIHRTRTRRLGWCTLKAVITDAGRSYMTPASYEISVLDAEGSWRRECLEAARLETYRLRFMELKEGMLIKARGIVELRGSSYIVVPDHPGGLVKPL